MIEIVDTIGGIDVDVELDFCEQDENRSFKKDDLICLKKGEQHLDGKQALAYPVTVKPRAMTTPEENVHSSVSSRQSSTS